MLKRMNMVVQKVQQIIRKEGIASNSNRLNHETLLQQQIVLKTIDSYINKQYWKIAKPKWRRNKPWFRSLVQNGRTCTKGANFCLSASNAARYLPSKQVHQSDQLQMLQKLAGEKQNILKQPLRILKTEKIKTRVSNGL